MLGGEAASLRGGTDDRASFRGERGVAAAPVGMENVGAASLRLVRMVLTGADSRLWLSDGNGNERAGEAGVVGGRLDPTRAGG